MTNDAEKLSECRRIALLVGGLPYERHDVDRTAANVHAALEELRFQVVAISVTGVAALDLIAATSPDLCFIIDPFFLADESGNVGDIRISLEQRSIRYTGSSASAAAICKDKIVSKEHFVALGIDTPRHARVSREMASLQVLQQAIQLGFPVIIKPIDEGAGLGVNLCRNPRDLEAIAPQLFVRFHQLMLEEYVEGKDVTVGVIGRGDRARAMVPVELELTSSPIYDYTTKLQRSVIKHIPARLPESRLSEVRDSSRRIHVDIGCAGITRVDYRVTPDRISCLEINGSPLGNWGAFATPGRKGEGVASNNPQPMEFSDLLLAMIEDAWLTGEVDSSSATV
jgi:D-alanine-D-alanine ligase